LFDPQDEIEIKKRLADIPNDVKLILFSQSLNCDTCPETERLLRALADLSERLKLEIYNPQIDREKATQYTITRVPALVIEGDRDYGIRYFGIPGGYEFAALLEDIVAVGKRESGLSEASNRSDSCRDLTNHKEHREHKENQEINRIEG
jgi:alkyl hydroperoxide reductase subunit AhpF